MRALALLALLLCSACTHIGIQRAVDPQDVEALYWSAVANLDPSNKSGTLDGALANLDAYLASPRAVKHTSEASALRTLARSAQQLSRMEAALQQARAAAASPATSTTETRRDPDSKARDDDMVKEIQRLKDELAKANEELERIKKRLAAPKP